MHVASNGEIGEGEAGVIIVSGGAEADGMAGGGLLVSGSSWGVWWSVWGGAKINASSLC